MNFRRKEIRKRILSMKWDNIPEQEWEKLPCGCNQKVWRIDLKTFAEAELKKAASCIGIEYTAYVRRIFLRQNKQFFRNVRKYANNIFQKNDAAIRNLRVLLLIPQVKKADEILEMVEDLSPEEQDKFMLKIAQRLNQKSDIEEV